MDEDDPRAIEVVRCLLAEALRERDEARAHLAKRDAQCAARRKALQIYGCHTGACSQAMLQDDPCSCGLDGALSTDAGKGWVSPEEYKRVCDLSLRTYCIYCGQEYAIAEADAEQLQAHIKVCPKHPLPTALMDLSQAQQQIQFWRTHAEKSGSENVMLRLEDAKVQIELEKLRAVAKDVVTSRSVAYFDSDQLSHVYVSVDGALLVKVREALDALEEKP